MIRFAQLYRCLPILDDIIFQISWYDKVLKDENKMRITCSKLHLCSEHPDGYLFALSDMRVDKLSIEDGKFLVEMFSNHHPYLQFDGFEQHNNNQKIDSTDEPLKVHDLVNDEILDKEFPFVSISVDYTGKETRREFDSCGTATLPYSVYRFNVARLSVGTIEDPIKKTIVNHKEAIVMNAEYPPLYSKEF